MKWFLLLSVPILLLVGCKSKASTPNETDLSKTDTTKQYQIQQIDHLVAAIKAHKDFYREVDSALAQKPNGETASVIYLKDFDYRGGKLHRFTSIAHTQEESATFTYYYSREKVVKLEMEFTGLRPETAYCYFKEGTVLHASREMSAQALQAALTPSELMLQKIRNSRQP